MIACIYMSGGLFFSIKYAIRVGYLCELGSQNDRVQKILSEYKNEEQILRVAASKDTLTGLWLQVQGKNKLQQMTWKGFSFSLCVVDLDGLEIRQRHAGACQRRCLFGSSGGNFEKELPPRTGRSMPVWWR